MNFLPCRLEEANGALRVRLSGESTLPVPPARAERYRAHVGRDGLTFGLRPEHLAEDRGDGGAQANAIDAMIEVAEPLGMETLVFFHINEVEVCGRVSPTAGARRGAAAALRPSRQHAPDRRGERTGDLRRVLINRPAMSAFEQTGH